MNFKRIDEFSRNAKFSLKNASELETYLAPPSLLHDDPHEAPPTAYGYRTNYDGYSGLNKDE